jgi:predicted transcriptional regulator of viral defense system
MVSRVKQMRLVDCLDKIQASGRYYFTFDQIKNDYGIAHSSFRQQVAVLQKKGKVVLIRNGFYVIVPPEYRINGAPPVTHYIDGMMNYLNRNYYIGLLNAAVWYGAAHHQPQSYTVIIQVPYLPIIHKKFASIHFVYKKKWDQAFILKKETNAGFVNVSSPALTAMDLCNFSKHAGGISQVATVINELAEEIQIKDLALVAENYNNLMAVQRLGYIFEFLGKEVHAQELKKFLSNKKIYPAKLEASNKNNSSKVTGNDWKIIVNEQIEIDE